MESVNGNFLLELTNVQKIKSMNIIKIKVIFVQ
jgi:hypothetical protein